MGSNPAVNGHPLPADGNIDMGSSSDIGEVIAFARIAATAIDTSGNIDTPTISGDTALTGKLTITDTDAQSLAVGANGATNPVLEVDTSTASVATGLEIKGAAAASGVAVTAISSGTNESVTIDAKGTGTITLNGTATGNVIANTSLQTGANNGTANTGVTAVEYGDGFNHTTVLTVSQANALTPADNAALADGYLLYTLPAGACLINSAYMSIALTSPSTEQQSDTPDVGIGTVTGSGANATLDAVGATSENIITGQTAADANGTATVKAAGPTAGVPLEITSGGAHTIYLNAADTWADDTGGDLDIDISGTVVLNWTFLA